MATEKEPQFTTMELAYYVELAHDVPVVVQVGDYLYRITGVKIEHDKHGFEERFVVQTADQAFGSPIHAEGPAGATLSPAGEDAGAPEA